MTFDEIENLVRNDLPLSDMAEYIEYSCYECLKALYTDYKKQVISKELAGIKKKKLRRLYDLQCLEHLNYKAALAQYQDNIRRAGMLRCDINKANNLKDVALIACECIGLMCGEMVSFNLMKERIDSL